jgi:hypothetical protein
VFFLPALSRNGLDTILSNGDFSAEITLGEPYEDETPEPFDFCLTGSFEFPAKEITFFRYSWFDILAGPVPLTFEVTMGGQVGARVGVKGCLVSLNVEGTVTPYLAAEASFFGGLGIAIFSVGLRLTAVVLSTEVPFSGADSSRKDTPAAHLYHCLDNAKRTVHDDSACGVESRFVISRTQEHPSYQTHPHHRRPARLPSFLERASFSP